MASTSTKEDLLGTRQLLDELDVLMNQMLAVPVEDAEGDRPLEASPDPSPTVAATLTMLGTSFDTERVPAPSETQTRQPPAPLRSESKNIPIAPISTQNSSEEVRIKVGLLTQVASPSKEDLLPPPDTVGGRSNRRFFVRINQRFDRSMLWFGKPGRFFRGRLGKMILGLTGLALLAAGALWLRKDLMGWNWWGRF